MKNILVIAPHPDDETLGCGGTLLKHKFEGDRVFCIFVTNVINSCEYSKEFIEKRQEQIKFVSKEYKFDKYFCLNYPAAKLTQNDVSLLIKDFSCIFNEITPEIIYLPFYGDIHSDHRIIFEAASACTKTFRYNFIKQILCYETISETNYSLIDKFIPNYFNDISDFMNDKLKIIKFYESEVQNNPLPRSIEKIKAQASYNGANICCDYAEAFLILKYINK